MTENQKWAGASEAICRLSVDYLLERDEAWQFGFEGDVQMATFVNFMAAVHVDATLDTLSDIMARLIRHHIDYRGYCIVGPKRGNVLLQREVARRLRKPSAFALDPPLFDRWVEGMAPPDSEAVIVDDISSESDILVTAVECLRERGHRVRHAFALLNRVEGDAEQVLARHGVQLHFIVSLSDDDLRGMAMRRLEERDSETLRRSPTTRSSAPIVLNGGTQVPDVPDVSGTAQARSDHPPAIDWWVTSKCNLACDFCFGPAPDVKEDSSLRPRIADALVESKAPRITLTGGEPLVVPSLVTLVERLAAGGKDLILNTNGEMLTERRADHLKVGDSIQCVAVSIDGGTDELHRLMRGHNARFERSVAAARLVSSRGASLKVASVISAVNVESMHDLVELVTELEPTVWRLLQFSHRSQGDAAERHNISTEQFAEAVELARALVPDSISVAAATEDELCGCFTLSERGEVLVPRVGGYDLLGSCFEESIDELWRRSPNSNNVMRNKRWHQVLDSSSVR